jgi:hypothetical protein
MQNEKVLKTVPNSAVRREDWDSSNALDLHSRATRFEEKYKVKTKKRKWRQRSTRMKKKVKEDMGHE